MSKWNACISVLHVIIRVKLNLQHLHKLLWKKKCEPRTVALESIWMQGFIRLLCCFLSESGLTSGETQSTPKDLILKQSQYLYGVLDLIAGNIWQLHDLGVQPGLSDPEDLYSLSCCWDMNLRNSTAGLPLLLDC